MQSSETCKVPNLSLENIKHAKESAKEIKTIIDNSIHIPIEKRKNALAVIDTSITTLNNPSGYNRKTLSSVVGVFLAIATSLANSTMLSEEESYKSVALADKSTLVKNFAGSCLHQSNYQTFNGLFNVMPYLSIPVNKDKHNGVSLGSVYEILLNAWNEDNKNIDRSLDNFKFINYFSDDVHLPNNARIHEEINPNFSDVNEIQLKDLMISLKHRNPSQINDVSLTKKMTNMIRRNLDTHFIPLIETKQRKEVLIPGKIYTVPLDLISMDINLYLHDKTKKLSKGHAVVLYMRLLKGKIKYGIMDIQNLFGDWNRFQSFSEDGKFNGNPIGIFEPGFWKKGDLFYKKLSDRVVKFDDPFFYLIKQWSIDENNNPTEFPIIATDYNIQTLISPPIVSTLDNFMAYTYKLGQAYKKAIDLKYIYEFEIIYGNYASKGTSAFKWLFRNNPQDDLPPDEFKYKLMEWYIKNKKEILSIDEQLEYTKLGKKIEYINPIRILLKEKYTELSIKLDKLNNVRGEREIDKVFSDAQHVFDKVGKYVNTYNTPVESLKKLCKIVIDEIEIVNKYIPPDPDWKISTICKLVTSWLFPLNNMICSNLVSDTLNKKYDKYEKIEKLYKDFVSANKDADIEEEQKEKIQTQAKSVSPIFEEPKPSWFQTTRKNWLGWGGSRRKRNRRTYKRKYKLKRK